jgi:serine protease Do
MFSRFLLTAAVALLCSGHHHSIGQDTSQTQTDQAISPSGPRALSRAFRKAARKATPAVVTIFTYGQNANQPAAGQSSSDRQPSVPDDKLLTGLGSGVIVKESGMVITNNHVIMGAKRVKVQLLDESEFEATQMVGDPDSDVAMLKIDRDEPFPSAEIGDSDGLEIGDWVLAIGSPFKLEATVSAGIISAKNRRLERIRRGRLLQTDAAINPGNSGGPLIDLDGNVIAINTAIATRNTGYQGVGFAIPINQAKWIADELARHGRVRRAAMGTTLVDLKPRIAKQFNLEPNLGILIYQIIDDSVAKRAGLEKYDVILEFAGERVRSSSSLQEVIERTPIGSMQDIRVLRKGKELTLQVELATVDDPTGNSEKPEKNLSSETGTPAAESGQPKDKESADD